MTRNRPALLLAAAFAAAWLAALGLTLASARLPASASGRVLALFPPHLDGPAAASRIAAAGGIPLACHGAAFAWTAYARGEGFAGHLRDQGALLVIPPLGDLRIPPICGSGIAFASVR